MGLCGSGIHSSPRESFYGGSAQVTSASTTPTEPVSNGLLARPLDDRAYREVDRQRDPSVERKNDAEERSDQRPVLSPGIRGSSHLVPLVCASEHKPDRQSQRRATVIELLPLPRSCARRIVTRRFDCSKHSAALEGLADRGTRRCGGSVLADVGDSLLVLAEEMHPAAAPSSA